MRFRSISVLLAMALAAFSQSVQGTRPAGTSFTHFAQLDKQVFVGSKPHSDKDFEYLRSKGVKYVLNARFLPGLSFLEKRQAQRYGMKFISIPMNASPIAPSEKHVSQILLAMKNPQTQPIYLHCVLGRDRTSLLSGLYKIYFLGVSKPDAWQQMRQSGFRTSWFLRGLKSYFDKHASQPPR